MQYDIEKKKINSLEYDLDFTIKSLIDLFKRLDSEICFINELFLCGRNNENFVTDTLIYDGYSQPCYIPVDGGSRNIAVDKLTFNSMALIIHALEKALKPIIKKRASEINNVQLNKIISSNDEVFDAWFSYFMDNALNAGKTIDRQIMDTTDSFVLDINGKIIQNLTSNLIDYLDKNDLFTTFVTAAIQPVGKRNEAMEQFYNNYITNIHYDYASILFTKYPDELGNAIKLNNENSVVENPIYDNPTLADLATLIIGDEFNLFRDANAETNWLE